MDGQDHIVRDCAEHADVWGFENQQFAAGLVKGKVSEINKKEGKNEKAGLREL